MVHFQFKMTLTNIKTDLICSNYFGRWYLILLAQSHGDYCPPFSGLRYYLPVCDDEKSCNITSVYNDSLGSTPDLVMTVFLGFTWAVGSSFSSDTESFCEVSDLSMNEDSSDQVGSDDFCLSGILVSHTSCRALQQGARLHFGFEASSTHMTCLREVLIDVCPCERSVSVGDMNVTLKIKARGRSRMSGLGPFRWVPQQLSKCLISISALDRIGCRTVNYDEDVHITHRRERTILAGTSTLSTLRS